MHACNLIIESRFVRDYFIFYNYSNFNWYAYDMFELW